MDDEYSEFSTKIFIDSNVVLEALPLKDLPWSEIDPIGPILILLTPTLLSEVDSKKRDGRLGVRAREFNRLVAPIVEHGQPINLVEDTPRVDIVIARCHRIDWDSYDDLDPSQGDARIIAEVLNVSGIPEEQRRVVSQDINPLFMAQRHGLKTHHASDNWLPRPEPSPQEKEIAKLKGQVREYAKTEPQFDIKFTMQPVLVEVHHVQKLTEGEVSMMVRDIIATNPKPEQKQGLLSQMQYDSSLDDRYAKYERKTIPGFVRDYHKKLELLFGQIPFTLSVENTGKVRADHTNIDVQIVGGWFNTKPILAGLRPVAPKVRNPLLFSHFPHPIPIRRVVGRHEIEVNEPRRSEYFSAQCEDFRHGQKWVFSGVVWLDPHQDREIVIIVKVTAANFHGEICMPFKFDKSVLSCRVSDLVDIKSGKVVKDYYVKSLVNEAIKENKYDAFEWDRISDED
jgi:hypothetical protein